MDARQALAAGWSLNRAPAPAESVSRDAWYVTPAMWLTAGPAVLLRRENRLLALLATRLRGTVAVPEVIPTHCLADCAEEVFVDDTGRGWRLTRGVPGSVPDADDIPTYMRTIAGLREVHAVLRVLPLDLAVSPAGPLAGAEAHLGEVAPHRCIESAAARFVPLLPRLAGLPVQLVQGDWALPNLRVNGRPGQLCGVLDFERSGPAPVHADVAQVISSVLMWSGLDDKEAAAARLVDAYGGLVLEDVAAALLAYCLANAWWAWERAQHGERRALTAWRRQPARLQSVLAYLDTLGVAS